MITAPTLLVLNTLHVFRINKHSAPSNIVCVSYQMNDLPIPRQVTVANMHQRLTLMLNNARDPM